MFILCVQITTESLIDKASFAIGDRVSSSPQLFNMTDGHWSDLTILSPVIKVEFSVFALKMPPNLNSSDGNTAIT